MTLTESVQRVLVEDEQKFAEREEFRNLQEFYTEMQKRGIALKHEYDLPALDTIGRTMYSIASPPKPPDPQK